MRIIHSLLGFRHRMYSVGSDSYFLLSGRWVTWIREFPCSGPVFVYLSHVAMVLPCLYCNACIYPWGLFTKLKESLVCFCICASPWSCSAAFHRRLCFWYALHSVGCLLFSWAGLAEKGCMLLQLSVSSAWMIWACSLCQLHPFYTVSIRHYCDWGGVLKLFRQKKAIFAIGSPWGRATMLFMKDIFLLPLSSEEISKWVNQKCLMHLCID